MLVTLAEFNTYTGNCETSTEVDAMKTEILESAQNIVSDFLRFDPENYDWMAEEGLQACPKIIKLSVKRIATLLLMEAGENIGVTSKSMPDNSRTFINYTNYFKYLRPIQNYRLEKF